MDVVRRAQDDEDPFLELDECMELQNLIEETIPSEQSCSLVEYLHGEEEVPVCVDMDGDDWDTNFLAELGGGGDYEEDEDADENDEDEEPMPKVKTFSEAIKALDNVNSFWKVVGMSRKQVQSALQWIWLHLPTYQLYNLLCPYMYNYHHGIYTCVI